MNYIDNLINKAQKQTKTIVLAEGNEEKNLKAASYIMKHHIANLVLLGNPEYIQTKLPKSVFHKLQIINPINFPEDQKYAQILLSLRKHKGLTESEAFKLIHDPIYLGTILVYCGKADGMVAGAIHTSHDVLKPALQIIKTAPQHPIASTFFIVELPYKQFGHKGLLFFADCGLNINPDSQALAEIALDSAKSFQTLVGKKPKVALLSYSTYGSALGNSAQIVRKAQKIAQAINPDLEIDGELQVDAALIPSVSKLKAPDSVLKGKANVLIFPDINSANIGYKLTQRLAKANAYGPITQGLSKPINDLSRGCSAQDIIAVVAITCIQASSVGKKQKLSPSGSQHNSKIDSYSQPHKSKPSLFEQPVSDIGL